MISYEIYKNKIVKLSDGIETLYLKFIDAETLRIYSNEHHSYTFLKKLGAYSKFEIEENDGKLTFKTSKLMVVFNDGFSFKIYHLNNLVYEGSIEFNAKFEKENSSIKEKEGHKSFEDSEYKFLIKSKLYEDDNFYGLGDKTGFLNKKYYEFVNYNTDDPSIQLENMPSLYKSINLFYDLKTEGSFAVFLDNTYKTLFNFGTNLSDYYFGSVNGEIDVYFYFKKSIKALITRVTKDLGRNELPPLKALGNQQSRWSYANKEQVQAVIDGYNKFEIPLDVIHLDIDYMDNYKDFTINENNFGNFQNWLHNLDKEYQISIVTIIDSGVKQEKGYFVYDEGIKNNYFVTLDNELYVNEVWPGDSVFPNFNSKKVREWWSEKCSELKRTGILGIWNDMNEPASFRGPLPPNVEFKDDKDKIHYHDEIHNVYGHLMCKATYNGIKEIGYRPFVITRAAFMGTNRYSSVWTGDNHSIYSHLQLSIPQLVNLSLSGFAFCGTDVGGFSANCTKELLIRWIESAFLSPLLRNHSAIGTKNQEPYAFDEETAKIYKKFVDLRYELLPYLYDCFYEHYLNGFPILRPLFLYNQNDKNTYNINDQFMVGENIMLCPIVEQGKTVRTVYLPKGKWVNYFTNEVFNGGKMYMFNAKIDETLMFAKYNSVIPFFDNYSRIQNEYKNIKFKLYGKRAKYTHYKDDYNSLDYKNGKTLTLSLKIKNEKVDIRTKNNGIKSYDNVDVIDVLNTK